MRSYDEDRTRNHCGDSIIHTLRRRRFSHPLGLIFRISTFKPNKKDETWPALEQAMKILYSTAHANILIHDSLAE